MSVRQSPAWQMLDKHYHDEIKGETLANLFVQDSGRFARFSVKQNGYLLDFSKQRITQASLDLLIRLVEQQHLSEWINRLFGGDSVNTSENRPALHTALRSPENIELTVDGQPVGQAVHQNLKRMTRIVERIHAGHWRGFSGKPIRDIVNLGVGGSDLGPLMACHALEEFRHPRAATLNLHFVSSIDGSQLSERLKHLNQETTLFILSSKSFTTIDTLSNAETAKRWLAEKVANESIILSQHFIGCSASVEKMSAWGIPATNQLEFWDWVGGRYSLWSVIGLPIALMLGMERFREMLDGARAMDEHFRTARPAQNLPVLMALMGLWNGNFIGVKGHAVLPYDGRLKYFPGYLTQLEMESNGKSVTRSGERVDYDTCPIIWGDVGPNAQHAFFQLLHQGTQPVSCDFIAPVVRYQGRTAEGTLEQLQDQQRLTLANCLAQSRLLMLGDRALPSSDLEQRPVDQQYDGNQPSTTLLIQELSPHTLGGLVALYEHKVFVQSVIWEINPFDQWGVELGKQIAKQTYSAMGDCVAPFDDSSTEGLLDYIRQHRIEEGRP